jgi:polyisoprenoid-binding protein YceI
LDSSNYQTAKMILENTLKNEFFEADKFPLAYFEISGYKNESGK